MPGAVTGMIVGLTFTLAYIIYFKFGAGTPDQYLWNISPEGIGTIGMLINLFLAVTISRLTAAPPAHVQELVEEIRVPRRSRSNSHE